jgi:serine/threonine-protein kinase HipA
MKRAIKVFLGSAATPVGVLRFGAQGARQSTAFDYDAGWLAAPDRFALDPALPLVAGPQFRKKSKEGSIFPLAIADTEPDGWARRVVLRDHAKRRRAGDVLAASLNELDFLLAVDDQSRVGALRFQDEQGAFQRAADPFRRRAPPLVELRRLLKATRAVETDTESSADLAYLRGRGTSLGGMRPKCTVVDAAGLLSIGKFPSVADERSVTRGEVLAMRLAIRAGINAAHAELVDSDGVPVALIRRFDRRADGTRLMYVSAATMLAVDADGTEEHSYTEIVDALRVNGAAPQIDIEELWRRIAFSILITNVDDHLKNHGFLHAERGLWRLSPAFDLNPSPEGVREL